MPQITPLMAGDPSRLGSFRLTGRIGEGGQGVVYLGVNHEGERAAIKLLHVKFTGDASARSRFARELRASQRVAPFCTAKVIEADLEGDTPYIASEYIEGRSLRDHVESEGPLRGTALDRLAIGTATALTAIHHAAIVHRDFKPDNVLLAADGPRVVDFGIARILDSTGTITSKAIGTPAYMAPEQIAGDDVGPYTDVFAWGATIAFAATGETVFEGNSIAIVLNRILTHEVDVGMMPQPLRGVVQAALSKSPADRPSADQILLRLLGQPETVSASTALLSRGVQVAGDDTTPLRRVSVPDVPPPQGAQASAVTSFPAIRASTGSGGGGAVEPEPVPEPERGPEPPAEPPAEPPRGKGRAMWWVALAAALAVVVTVAVAAVINRWPPFSGQDPDLSKGPEGPSTYSSVAERIARTGRVIIGVKGDLPGVGLRTGDTFEGFDVDLARHIAAGLGAKDVEFVAVSPATRAKALAEGDVDMVVATYSIVDDPEVAFAGPYYLAHQDVLVPDGTADSIDDLKGKKICAVNSVAIAAVQRRVKVVPVPAGNYAECMDMLRGGTVDGVPGEDVVLAGFAGRESERFRLLGAGLSNERYGVGLRKGDARTCKAISGVIADLYRKDLINQLVAKHFGNVAFKPETKVPAMEPCE